MGLNLRALRSNLRLTSALIMLAFVVCHLAAHSVLLISFGRAQNALNISMGPWRTALGTAILASALLVHYSNALWSIYVRRYLRLSRWEWWQLGLGLMIPMLLMVHSTGGVQSGGTGIEPGDTGVLPVNPQPSVSVDAGE